MKVANFINFHDGSETRYAVDEVTVSLVAHFGGWVEAWGDVEEMANRRSDLSLHMRGRRI